MNMIQPDLNNVGPDELLTYATVLIVGSTNMRRVSPQGEGEWWEGFNNSTNSRGEI